MNERIYHPNFADGDSEEGIVCALKLSAGVSCAASWSFHRHAKGKWQILLKEINTRKGKHPCLLTNERLLYN